MTIMVRNFPELVGFQIGWFGLSERQLQRSEAGTPTPAACYSSCRSCVRCVLYTAVDDDRLSVTVSQWVVGMAPNHALGAMAFKTTARMFFPPGLFDGRLRQTKPARTEFSFYPFIQSIYSKTKKKSMANILTAC